MIFFRIFLLILIAISFFGCSSEPKVETSEKYGEEIYIYEGIEFPSALGEPKLKKKDLEKSAKSSLSEMKESIDNYADAIMFLKNKTYGNEQRRFVSDLIFLLEGDYEEIEPVYVFSINQEYHVLSIKTKDRYYLLDPFSTHMGNDGWLEGYETEHGSFADKDSLKEAVYYGCPRKNKDYVTYMLKDPEGKDMDMKFKDGMLLYNYQGFNYPYDYGLPELSENDINDLIREAENGNYENVKETIRTIPDFVYFFKRRDFKGSNRDSLQSTSSYSGGDVGNIRYYDDQKMYTISGKEAFIVNEGQCTSTSTLAAFILTDDFDEFGYVNIHFEDRDRPGQYDGHAINYFKKNDKYYLMSPSYYLAGDGAWLGNTQLWSGTDTLEEVMNKLLDSSYPDGKVAVTIAFAFDGVYCLGDENGRGPGSTYILPEGSECKVCLECDYRYTKAKHPTSQDYVIGVQLKNPAN